MEQTGRAVLLTSSILCLFPKAQDISFQGVNDKASAGEGWFREPTKTIPQQLSRMHQQRHQDESGQKEKSS